MKTILCPTDFSPNAENAVRYAIEMNKELKAKIILFHAFETPLIYAGGAVQVDYATLHSEAAEMLKTVHKKLFNENDNVELILQQGLAAWRIREIAIEKKVDMIIMGATGTNAAERLLIGSSAVGVANEAHCKVMLIPSKAKFQGLEKMVYATDLSDDNLIQARELFPMARKFNSELLFLYVDNTSAEKDEEVLKRVTKQIKRFVSYGKKSGYVCSDISEMDGIEYFLKKNKADCLVMFHRHQNLFQKIYRASITKKISLHSTIPLIILHKDDFALYN